MLLKALTTYLDKHLILEFSLRCVSYYTYNTFIIRPQGLGDFVPVTFFLFRTVERDLPPRAHRLSEYLSSTALRWADDANVGPQHDLDAHKLRQLPSFTLGASKHPSSSPLRAH